MSAAPRPMSRSGSRGSAMTWRWSARCPTMRSATPRSAILRRYGVDCAGRRHRRRADGPLFPVAAAPGCARPTSIYDREGSAFARGPARTIATGTTLLAGADLLHLSGITPALGAGSGRDRDRRRRGATRARHPGLVRRQLPRAALGALGQRSARDPDAWIVPHADILFGNHRDISLLLGRDFSSDGEERRREAAEAAFAAFPKLQLIASTARHVEDADRHRISARIDGRDGRRRPRKSCVAGIVDRIGAGDAFAAGVLHGCGAAATSTRRGANRARARPASSTRCRATRACSGQADIDAFLAGETRCPALMAFRRRGVIGARRGADRSRVQPARLSPTPSSRPRRALSRRPSRAACCAFRGIRYGRAERFQRAEAGRQPRPTVPADAFGPSAPQQGGRYGAQSEDCLFLNIWTPTPRPGREQAGHGLYPWRRLFERQRHRSAARRPASSPRAATSSS